MSEINYIHSEIIHNDEAALSFLPYLYEQINPESVIDIGCGLGNWLNVFKQFGCSKVLGVDGSNVDRSKLVINDNEFVVHDLTQPLTLSKKFDLCVCLEVAEHLPESCSDALIQSLISCADTILFSAALPLQGGQNHINEQPFSYWINKFNSKGYKVFDVFRSKIWNNPNINWWYRQNMFLVCKSSVEQKPIMEFYHPDAYAQVANSQLFYKSIVERGNLPPSKALKILVKSLIKRQ
jgi:SAM-dependent methyltransferase